MDRYLALWREPGVRPLDGVKLHRANIPTIGMGIIADYLRECFWGNALVNVAALQEGFAAGPNTLDKDWPIIVVGFTPDGPRAIYPGVGEGLAMVALEASVYLKELVTFEQQQAFVGVAMAQAQQNKVMQDILAGARRPG